MSISRSGELAASRVCRVDSTMWPVIAARSPISAVSRSRISPIRMTSGSWRQRGAQHATEAELDLLVHLHLVQAVETVLDRNPPQ